MHSHRKWSSFIQFIIMVFIVHWYTLAQYIIHCQRHFTQGFETLKNWALHFLVVRIKIAIFLLQSDLVDYGIEDEYPVSSATDISSVELEPLDDVSNILRDQIDPLGHSDSHGVDIFVAARDVLRSSPMWKMIFMTIIMFCWLAVFINFLMHTGKENCCCRTDCTKAHFDVHTAFSYTAYTFAANMFFSQNFRQKINL